MDNTTTTVDAGTLYQFWENCLSKIVTACESSRKRSLELSGKLTESQERVDELEQALRESVMVAIDRDLEVNAGRLDAEEKVTLSLI